MADGTFAAALFLIGLFDTGTNYCGTEAGCFGRTDVQPRFSISGGQVLPRQAKKANEVYLRYDLGRKRGPFGSAAGLSIGENGETWIGFGTTLNYDIGQTPLFVELHAMPGVYFPNGGFDLGGPIAFRSGIEVGYENDAGWRFGLSYDHRSNAGIYKNNPGIETVQFRVSVPLK
tara:strand:- start:134 stop:655 length:522 start_codon:yes stop_codon:yes gene_type:complete